MISIGQFLYPETEQFWPEKPKSKCWQFSTLKPQVWHFFLTRKFWAEKAKCWQKIDLFYLKKNCPYYLTDIFFHLKKLISLVPRQMQWNIVNYCRERNSMRNYWKYLSVSGGNMMLILSFIIIAGIDSYVVNAEIIT